MKSKQVKVYYEGEEAFEKIHAEGTTQFGMNWLMANTGVTEDILRTRRCSLSDPAVKELLSFVVLSVLRTNKKGFQTEPPSRKTALKKLEDFLKSLPDEEKDDLNVYFDGQSDAIDKLIEWTTPDEVNQDVKEQSFNR